MTSLEVCSSHKLCLQSTNLFFDPAVVLGVSAVQRKGKNKDRYVLFDLAADPSEEKDLAASRNDDLVRMIAMDQRLDEEGATPSD